MAKEMTKKENVVLLEFKDEAGRFLEYCRSQNKRPEEFLIIALQPEVQVFLTGKGIRYTNTLRYLPNESHAAILLKSEEWIKFLEEQIELSDGSMISETYKNTFLFYARFYMFHFLQYVEILKQIKKLHKLAAVYVMTHDNVFDCHDPPHIQDSERFLNQIVKASAESRGFEFHSIEMPVAVVQSTFKNKKTILQLPEEAIAAVFKSLWRSVISKKKVVLLTTTGYNVGKLVQDLKSGFPDTAWAELTNKKASWCIASFFGERIYRMKKAIDARLPVEAQNLNETNSESYATLQKDIYETIEKLGGKWANKFEYEKVNFIQVFGEKIKVDLMPYLLKLHNESKTMEAILEQLDVKLLISPFARDRSLLIAELCRKKGIATLMISHGTIVEPKNELEEIEYRHMGETLTLSKFYNYAAMQTPLHERHLAYYKSKNVPVRTGNLIFAKTDPAKRAALRQAVVGLKNANKKILLYPENTRVRSALRFQVFQTFDEFLSSCIDLVHAVDNLTDSHLVIRLHAGGTRLTPEEFRSLLPKSENFTITAPDSPFSETLTTADLLLNFSSTVIEDALQNNIPVLLYDKTKRYQHLQSQRLEPKAKPEASAVYYIDDAAYLEKGLGWILDNHLNNPDVKKSIFDRHVFGREQYNNLITFISEKVKN